MRPILIILIIITLAAPAVSQAQVPGLQNLIGGKIQRVEMCCNGVKIKVGEPRGGEFLFIPGLSKLYAYYNIFTTGVWVLGTASGVATCQQLFSFPPCVWPEVVKGGIIRMIGSSGL